MNKLLKLKVGDEIYIKNTPFIVKSPQSFIQKGALAKSYLLKNKDSYFKLEIKKEFALNYQIFLYELVEKITYNKSFISILGTNTLGFNNPKISSSTVFSKVNLRAQKYDLIKHIVCEDELPLDHTAKGYHKDENGNWYFFTKKYSPLVRKTKDESRYIWEYKQDNNIRLQITTEADKSNYIYIYKGKELWQSEVSFSKSLKTAPQQQKSQIPSTLF